ncbi:hypothetical protein OJ997_22535 [Solirubrobacter phytolaccae]|uniref:DUF385 domain-containing protein n=1 Tax=Solirubrobacter phytolaccae TaxID=1404360 RepID=A0A9X3NBL9_9ACTN|nr:hypothetical protein [Solirubrobacter phytolaccae]MDA0183104.1 hypothetical protein [Solirubrobacter phytolaccae]
MLMRRVVNPVMDRLLRSRFHALAGRHTVLLEVRGRRSGRVFRVPVTALPGERAGELIVRSRPGRTWWRNLRGGAPVGVWIGGSRRTGVGTVRGDDQDPCVSLRFE